MNTILWLVIGFALGRLTAAWPLRIPESWKTWASQFARAKK